MAEYEKQHPQPVHEDLVSKNKLEQKHYKRIRNERLMHMSMQQPLKLNEVL